MYINIREKYLDSNRLQISTLLVKILKENLFNLIQYFYKCMTKNKVFLNV